MNKPQCNHIIGYSSRSGSLWDPDGFMVEVSDLEGWNFARHLDDLVGQRFNYCPMCGQSLLQQYAEIDAASERARGT